MQRDSPLECGQPDVINGNALELPKPFTSGTSFLGACDILLRDFFATPSATKRRQASRSKHSIPPEIHLIPVCMIASKQTLPSTSRPTSTLATKRLPSTQRRRVRVFVRPEEDSGYESCFPDIPKRKKRSGSPPPPPPPPPLSAPIPAAQIGGCRITLEQFKERIDRSLKELSFDEDLIATQTDFSKCTVSST